MALARFVAVAVTLIIVALINHWWVDLVPVAHLFYLPILLAALYYGYIGGLSAAVAAIVLFHLTHFVFAGVREPLDEADLLRFTLYLTVGLVTARLVSARRQIQRLADDLQTSNDELARLSEARVEFVAIASHEIRNPLTAILGHAELLTTLRPLSPERQDRSIGHIVEAARRLQRTVDMLLNSSLMEVGKFELRQEVLPVGQLLEECQNALPHREARRLLVANRAADATIRGDRDRLCQVLLNLIGNACKYSTGESPVTLSVEVGADSVWIAVADRGYGIAAEDLAHVFDRHYRAGDGRVRQARGFGLGLSISREIARAHGGELRALSTPGEGSVFTLQLPRPDRSSTHGPSAPGVMPPTLQLTRAEHVAESGHQIPVTLSSVLPQLEVRS